MALTYRQMMRVDALGFVLQWFLVGGAAWTILALFCIRQSPAALLADAGTAESETIAVPAPVPTDAELEVIWQRDLRQALLDPPPPKAPEPTKPPPPPPPVKLPRLVATFVEGSLAWGWFVQLDGKSRLRTVADQIDGLEIVAIRPGEATLRRGGRTHEVEVPRRDAESAFARSSHRKR